MLCSGMISGIDPLTPHEISLCIEWMMGWEDVEELKLPIVLAGCLPLRALVAILDLVIKYQVEL